MSSQKCRKFSYLKKNHLNMVLTESFEFKINFSEKVLWIKYLKTWIITMK